MSACGDRSDTIRINYVAPLTLDLGSDTSLCPGQLPFNLESTAGFSLYQWNSGDTTRIIRITQGGLYRCNAWYPCGTAADSVTVILKPAPPVPLVSDTTACQGDTAFQLHADGENIRWYLSPADSAGQAAVPKVDVSEPGIKTLFVSRTVNGCTSERKEVRILVQSPPRISLPDTLPVCAGDRASLGVEPGNFTCRWNTGQTAPKIQVADAGVYTLMATNGCGTDSAHVHVVFYPCGSCLLVPNAFSPDGDGINDLFRPVSVCPVAEFHMEIYDRWGAVVCEVSDIARGWDGTRAGERMPPGVYPYVIRFTPGERREPEVYRGTVVIVN
jgi:gliding motility-associated-like protein